MRTLTAPGLALATYLVVAWLLYGSLFSPLLLATLWSGRLGLPLWRGIALILIAGSAWLSFRRLDKYVTPRWRPSVFVALAIVLPTILIGACADVVRHVAIAQLSPDRVDGHSFFVSIREAPREFQLFLHTAALKDCAPYAWSYRDLAFYKLPPNTAVNVVPRDWIDTCAITRENRP